jgi:hypothetical protein
MRRIGSPAGGVDGHLVVRDRLRRGRPSGSRSLAVSGHPRCGCHYEVAPALDRDGVLIGLDVVNHDDALLQFGVATPGNALSPAVDNVLADCGDARVTELPIRPWWTTEMIEAAR